MTPPQIIGFNRMFSVNYKNYFANLKCKDVLSIEYYAML